MLLHALSCGRCCIVIKFVTKRMKYDFKPILPFRRYYTYHYFTYPYSTKMITGIGLDLSKTIENKTKR